MPAAYNFDCTDNDEIKKKMLNRHYNCHMRSSDCQDQNDWNIHHWNAFDVECSNENKIQLQQQSKMVWSISILKVETKNSNLNNNKLFFVRYVDALHENWYAYWYKSCFFSSALLCCGFMCPARRLIISTSRSFLNPLERIIFFLFILLHE